MEWIYMGFKNTKPTLIIINMKNLSLITVLIIFSLAACKKNTNTENPPNPTQVTYPNKVTLIDNGQTYTITGYSSSNPKAAESPVLIDSYLDTVTFSDLYYFKIDTYSGDAPFQLSFIGSYPKKNGIYSSMRGSVNRTIELNYISSIYKTFNLDSGFVTITHYTPDKITGDFHLYLDNRHEKRDVTGSFEINEPEL